jgi:dihydrofolate synthase/folylpolyglutamate synthase
MNIIDLAEYKESHIPRFDNLEQWLSWQEKLHFTAIELGLDRCRKVAECMQLLPPDYYVISIAGTNGKGSCATMLDLILRKAGYRVGLYTSPHLIRYNERIRVDGSEVSDAELCDSFARIDQSREDISLTYFEFGTLAAMDIFRQRGIDIAIMEVGMGGRLDAVNMLDANAALISTIDIDHERWLGQDRETIGREKSGIFRSMRPAVCADLQPPKSIFEVANMVGANLLRSGQDYYHDIHNKHWSWHSGNTRYDHLPIPAQQSCQVHNASGVLMVLQAISDQIPVQADTIARSLSEFSLPGRFQIVPGDITLVLDVAHNRQSASMLAENIQGLRQQGRVSVVLGMLNDKNFSHYMAELLPYVDKWYLSTLGTTRGASGQILAQSLIELNVNASYEVYNDLHHALKSAQSQAINGDILVICGSFITVGQAIEHFKLEI